MSDALKPAWGRVGACLPASFDTAPDVFAQRQAVERLEQAGYQAIWVNEVIGKDALVQLASLFSAAGDVVFGTCIANVWARPAQTLHAAAAQLAQAHPGRLALGVGVGYPEQAASTGREFGSPLRTMRDYLEAMDSRTSPPAPSAPYPRIVAANGPKMVGLAAEKADGAMPAGLPAEFTAQAREALGPAKLLVVGLSVLTDTDTERARRDVAQRLQAPGFAARMSGLGYSRDDIDNVSDRLLNAVVAQSDPELVAAAAQRHLDAGADHVVLLAPLGGDFAKDVEHLERLSPARA